MKKMMKKIKSNKLVPKLVAVLTICMVLLSSLSVSAFAADDEVSAANEETESITDVWTGVTDSLMSLLGTAQGVFIESIGSSNSIVLNSSDIIDNPDHEGRVSYYILLPGFDPSSAVVGENYDFEFLGDSASLEFIDVDTFRAFSGPASFSLLCIPSLPIEELPFIEGAWYLVLTEPFSGSATLTTPFSFSGGLQLTFLGTLAVVGVAIALIMLLVYVISRFLRLRG